MKGQFVGIGIRIPDMFLRRMFSCSLERIWPNLLDKTGVNLIRYLFSQLIISCFLAGVTADLYHYEYSNNQ